MSIISDIFLGSWFVWSDHPRGQLGGGRAVKIFNTCQHPALGMQKSDNKGLDSTFYICDLHVEWSATLADLLFTVSLNQTKCVTINQG